MARVSQESIDFVRNIVNKHGVQSCFDIASGTYPPTIFDLWFSCPHCQNHVIINDDFDFDFVRDKCPFCFQPYDA